MNAGSPDISAMIRRLAPLASLLGVLLFAPVLSAQVTVNLNSVIGAPGANAATVAGVGNAVNFTGYALNSGATTLTAAGSTGASSFDFNTGFADTQDRTTGSGAGAGNVFVDRKYDSGSTGTLYLDTDNNGSFAGESALTGFGMHGDTFVTFDLNVIRTNAGLAAGTAFTLTGGAGEANFTGYAKTSGAIILDSTQLAVFDWTETGPIAQFSTYSLSIAGSARYLTFIGLSGLDNNNWGAHVGFSNVQLVAVPEPAAIAVLAGCAALGLAALRRRRA
jgi:hypothetical protein